MSTGLGRELMTYVTGVLHDHVDDKIHVVASTIAPWVAASATLTILWWGLRLLRGQAHDPVSETATKFTAVVVYMVLSTNLWLWDEVIANFVFNGVGAITAPITGTTDPLGVADQIWLDLALAAESLAQTGFWTSPLIALSVGVVYALGALTWGVNVAMQTTSTTMVHTIAILAPVFFWLLMFEPTRRFFENFVTLIATYALMPLILAIVGTIMGKFLGDYAAKAAASGAVKLDDVYVMGGIVVVTVICMWMSGNAAAGLAGGMALSGMGAIGAIGAKVFNTARSTAYNSARGFADGARGLPRSQYAPITRNVANSLGQWARGGAVRNGGSLVPRYTRIPRSP